MKPLLLHYYVTNRCNSRCAFCSIWEQQPKIDARPEDVVKNLRQAREAGCRFVDFTGGEPLLNPHLAFFLREARKNGLITSVTTNCMLFPQQAESLSGLVDLLHFSLDADTPALHDELRGADCWASVLESIPAALSNGLAPDLLFTYTDATIDAFEGVFEIARKNRLVIILDPMFSLDGKDPVSASTHRKALAYSKRPGVYLNTAHLALRAAGGNRPGRSRCRAVSSTIVILPDNRLALPCYHHAARAVPLDNGLAGALFHPLRAEALEKQGRYRFCDGCHINCYFDPSYQLLGGTLRFKSMASKASYAFSKYVRYRRRIPRLWAALQKK